MHFCAVLKEVRICLFGVLFGIMPRVARAWTIDASTSSRLVSLRPTLVLEMLAGTNAVHVEIIVQTVLF